MSASTGQTAVRQLSLPIQLDDHATFDNFHATVGNSLALAAARAAAQAGESAFLFGPPGAGLSHLLQAACHEGGSATRYLPLAELADCGEPESVLEGLEYTDLLALDDIDTVVGNEIWEEQLFHLLNRLQGTGSTVLFSARQAPRQLPCRLPDLQSRLSWHPAIRVAPLNEDERMAALQDRAQRRGLVLDETVARYIMQRYSRDPARLFALLEVLDQRSLELQRRLTIAFVRQIMASAEALH